MAPKHVGVHPAGTLDKHQRLLRALELAFGLEFEERDAGDVAGLDALISFSAGNATFDAGLRCLAVAQEGGTRTQSSEVTLADEPPVDACLRGHALRDTEASSVPLIAPEADDIVLARSGQDPIWVRRTIGPSTVDIVSVPPKELDETEVLRDRLRAGCFIGLLPLIHFLREITADEAWTPPPLRACFLMDDANLHALSYGHLYYPALVSHGARHNYHVAMATVPLDAWYVSQHAARLFRDNPSRLSLLMHGNDHVYCELGEPLAETECHALFAQTLTRIACLEDKVGFPVSRIMVAPHGRCTEAMMRAMLLLGLEGICIDRPFPWLNRQPAERPLLAGWFPAELVAGGFPVIPRYHFNQDRGELPLRAFLGQPIILFGHHDDAAGGMDLFAEATGQINALGDVQWLDTGAIARSNYMTRREGETLFVKMFSRRVTLEVPEGVGEIVVLTPSAHPSKDDEEVLVGDASAPLSGGLTAPVPVRGSARIDIALRHPAAIAYEGVPLPRTKPWPALRRALTETRDRLRPLWHHKLRKRN